MNTNKEQDYKKGDVVHFENTHHIIMAVLSWPKEATTYSVCNTELLGPRFGVKIEPDYLIPYGILEEEVKRKVQNFL